MNWQVSISLIIIIIIISIIISSSSSIIIKLIRGLQERLERRVVGDREQDTQYPWQRVIILFVLLLLLLLSSLLSLLSLLLLTGSRETGNRIPSILGSARSNNSFGHSGMWCFRTWGFESMFKTLHPHSNARNAIHSRSCSNERKCLTTRAGERL